jgi:N-acylglucosamine-6-phosphate 2-epimerase
LTANKGGPAATLAALRHGLIVSCQAEATEPLYGASIMAAMARAAAEGGAVGIRANTPVDIMAIRAAVDLPVIGIYKVDLPGFAVRITPTVALACQVADAGAAIVAVDATARPHPAGLSASDLIAQVRAQTGHMVMADISTVDEGLAAQWAGADLIATTLSGYTGVGQSPDSPDFDLVQRLASCVDVPVIAEGRITTPEQAVHALELGAYAVVVGSAITRPQVITRRFSDRLRAYA